jgi:hypothetical protein
VARPGTFPKGTSGNPGGRPKDEANVRELAKELSAEAVERLASWMRSENPKASVSACNAILDRAFGRPAQSLTNADGTGPAELIIRWLTAQSKS